MVLPIITVPDPKLRQISKPVEKFDKKFSQFVADLIETLYKKEDPAGVGLSAVQTGKLQRIFVVNLPPVYDLKNLDNHHPEPEIKVFVNPEITDKSEKLTLGDNPKKPIPEGCLSIPALYGPVLRPKAIKIKYLTPASFLEAQDPKGASISKSLQKIELVEKTDVFSNFYARVVMHEYDHLDGILFTDYTLGQKQPIYFDQSDRLVEVPEPQKLITW